MPSGAVVSRRICGILGTIKLLGGPYLIAVTHRIFVGLLNGQPIWQLAGYDLIPYLPGVSHLTEEQKVQNELYLGMVRQTLDTPSYYFSYTSDLTHTQQRLKALPEDTQKLGIYERADKRFVWNDFVLRSFMRQDLRRYALPVILGCECKSCEFCFLIDILIMANCVLFAFQSFPSTTSTLPASRSSGRW